MKRYRLWQIYIAPESSAWNWKCGSDIKHFIFLGRGNHASIHDLPCPRILAIKTEEEKTFEQLFLTSKSNSLSLPISKANFTHQTLNPPENSTSVSKPFLHNMHSPKRKSSKFALFCQIVGSICYRFPHPLIFHNSSAVCENASQADVLFSVLFTNLSIICFFIQDS